MKTYNNRFESCFDYIEVTYCCKTYDNVFGKKPVIINVTGYDYM